MFVGHAFSNAKERQLGWRRGGNPKLQGLEATVVKSLVRRVGGSAAMYFITLDEGQSCSICLVF